MSNSTKKVFLVIDGHALLHRAWHALPPLNSPDGRVVHGAYGFVTIMMNAIRHFSPAYVAVTFDLKGPTFRHEAYKEYKATREKKPDELYGQVAYLDKILAAMRIPVFTAEGFEADDVIGTLAEMVKQTPDIETVIVTGDHDTLQLVDERTKVFTMRKGMADTITYDIAGVYDRYGFTPIQLIDYKALRGDTSDNIPGVKGIGEKTGTELISTFHTLPELYDALDENDARAQALKPAVREKLLAHRADALQAYDLCRIRRDVPIDFDIAKCEYHQPNRAQMHDVFVEYGFMKLLERLPVGDANDGAITVIPAQAGTKKKNKKEKAEAPEGKKRTKKPETNHQLSLRASEGSEAISVSTGSGKEIASSLGSSQRQVIPYTLPLITSASELTTLIDSFSKKKEFAFRIVPSTADPIDIVPSFLGLADEKDAYIIDGALVMSHKAEIATLFSSNAHKVCHDLKRELKAFAALDIEPVGPWFSLGIASYVLSMGERRHSLDALLSYRRGINIEEGSTPRAVLELELPQLIALAHELAKELKENDLTKTCDDIELPLASVLAHMERAGVTLDVKYMAKLQKEVGAEIEDLTKKIHQLAGSDFNINSPIQLKKVLFEDLGISSEGLKKTAGGSGLSTAAAELEKLKDAHPIVQVVLDYRELTKLQSTYIESLPNLVHPRTGRIHAGFNQTVAATGRLSSADPNLQNIPTPETPYGKKVRDGFIAEKGWKLFAADYSQFELRIVAHLVDEQAMIQAFKNGEDIHLRTAITMFGEEEAPSRRRLAKVINFGILYGMGPLRLAEAAGITFNEAKVFIAKYFDSHPGIAKYVTDTKAKAVEEGMVQTLLGRKRFFPNIKLMNPRERSEAERQAVNMPIQGFQADMIKLAMIRLDALITQKFPDTVRMIIQVHDELVFEVKEDTLESFIPEARQIMEHVYKLKVPVTINCSTGTRWGTMEKR